MMRFIGARVLKEITRIRVAANDNGRPPSPAAPAVFLRRPPKRWVEICIHRERFLISWDVA